LDAVSNYKGEKLKKIIFIIFVLYITILSSISVYDIQYTTDPGQYVTYPSTYEGQIVTTGGIVNAVDFNNGRFFITSSDGGDWNGIYVYDNDQNVAVGDSVIIEAEVYEYWGFTELSNLISCNIISSGNPLPALSVTTIAYAINEAGESTRIGIGYPSDLSISQTYDEWGQWKVTDGSNECTISTGFINLEEQGFPIIEGYPIDIIDGFVTYFWEEFQLNPVSINSIHSSPDDHIISTQDQLIFSPTEFEIPIYHTVFNDGQIQSYQFELHYDPDVITYTGYETDGTLSSGGSIVVNQLSNGIVSCSFNGNITFAYMENLLKLNFTGISSGEADLEFSEFDIDSSPVEYFSVEDITLQLESIAIGDTLTVIQSPIHTIPQITIPNEEFTIDCIADESTDNWSAKLLHKNKVVSLDIISTFYDSEIDRWQLNVSAPIPEVYELYDLVVNASGIIADTTRNAVQLIPEIRSNYSFVHITDTHLPTHIFYPDPLSLTDTTEVQDLREVIDDINLIDPEFVLLTGDLVNEGEMEDFENRRVYTKAQKLLEELKVPVYLTSGNHDIGGWDSSPPEQGTARCNWWKFFGWKWLEDPPASEPYYTQNYSFDYGPIHFIGMESYLNYDNFMYNIYGNESFTDMQLQWLDNDLLHAAGSESQVIFYHCDFSDQIDLNSMGLEMALWGHVHANSGSITSPPFNLSTESTCDGERGYRVINVINDQLVPNNTTYAGSSGEMLSATFSPENNGEADSLYCLIENYQSLNFNEAKLSFIMPPDAEEYLVYNGTLTQIDDSGEFTVCYVSCDIPSNTNISVSVVADFDATSDNILNKNEIQLTNYPNPFNPSTTISFKINNEINENTTLIIYNLKGQKIKVFSNLQLTQSVNHQVVWDGTNEKGEKASSGIYFVTLISEDFKISKKIMLMK